MLLWILQPVTDRNDEYQCKGQSFLARARARVLHATVYLAENDATDKYISSIKIILFVIGINTVNGIAGRWIKHHSLRDIDNKCLILYYVVFSKFKQTGYRILVSSGYRMSAEGIHRRFMDRSCLTDPSLAAESRALV